MNINENILRLSGKVSLPEPIEISNNYKLIIDGSVTGENLSDNHDGTYDKIFKFEPVLVEAITNTGKMIKGRDRRKLSRKLRGRIYIDWQEKNVEEDFDSYYEKTLALLIKNWEYVAETIGSHHE